MAKHSPQPAPITSARSRTSPIPAGPSCWARHWPGPPASPSGSRLARIRDCSPSAARTRRSGCGNVSDPAEPASFGTRLTGRTSYVWAVALSAEGTTLAAGVTDGTVSMWTSRSCPSSADRHPHRPKGTCSPSRSHRPAGPWPPPATTAPCTVGHQPGGSQGGVCADAGQGHPPGVGDLHPRRHLPRPLLTSGSPPASNRVQAKPAGLCVTAGPSAPAARRSRPRSAADPPGRGSVSLPPRPSLRHAVQTPPTRAMLYASPQWKRSSSSAPTSSASAGWRPQPSPPH